MADNTPNNYSVENPQSQFQQPPVIYRPEIFAQSLDSMFNNVIRQKLANSQIQAQQQQIAQAQQEQALQRGQSYLQNAAFGGPDPVSLGQQLLQNPQAGQSPQFNLDNHIQNYANMMASQYQLGIQQKEAETGKTSAEGFKAQTEGQQNAIINQQLAGTPGQPGMAQNVTQAAASGNIPLEMATELAGKNQGMRLAIGNSLASAANNGTNFTQIQAQQAGQKNAQMTQTGPQMQLRIRGLKSVLPELDTLSTIANRASGDMWQIGNKLNIAAKAEKGDEDANDLLTQIAIVKDRMNMKDDNGNASGSNFDAATQAIAAAKTRPQLQRSIQLLRNSVKNELTDLQGTKPKTPPRAEQPKQIGSKSDYDSVPSGNQFIWQGKTYTKQ